MISVLRNLARTVLWLALVLGAFGRGAGAEPGTNEAAKPVPAQQLLDEISEAFSSGKYEEGIALTTRAIEQAPANARNFYLRARLYEELRQPARALPDYDQALKLNPQMADAWQHRGIVQFQLAHVAESIADFDRFIALVPSQAAHHWQRGISLYYAGRYDEGRRQFELHRTVNPEDVENAVWHFLCVTRAGSLAKARGALIPIGEDPRVPMKEIHALFAGQTTPEAVLSAARAGAPPPAELKQRLFYAYLYCGLYCEATGDETRSREYIGKAAGEYANPHYMGDVARVHQSLRTAKK